MIRWAENLNFRRLFHNVHRAYYKDENQKFREIIKDLICLWTPSHGTEVVGGLAAFLTTIFTFQPLHVVSSVGLTALVISMPGFDPLCWILVGSYVLHFIKIRFDFSSFKEGAASVLTIAGAPAIGASHVYAWLVRVVRRLVTQGAVSLWRWTGLQKVALKIVELQPAKDYLLEDLIRRSEPGVYEVRTLREEGSRSDFFEMRIADSKQDPALKIRCLFRNNPDGSAALVRLDIDFKELEKRVSERFFSRFRNDLREYLADGSMDIRAQLRYLVMLSGAEEEEGIQRELLSNYLNEYEKELRRAVGDLVDGVLKRLKIDVGGPLEYAVGFPGRFFRRAFSGAHSSLRYSIKDNFRRRGVLGEVFKYLKLERAEQEAEGHHHHESGHHHHHGDGPLQPFYLQDFALERGELSVWFEPGSVHLRQALRRRNRTSRVPVPAHAGGRCALF